MNRLAVAAAAATVPTYFAEIPSLFINGSKMELLETRRL